jgi:hypothetical protein
MNWLSRGLGHGVLEELEKSGVSLRQFVEALVEAFGTTAKVEEQAQGALQAKCRSIGLITIGEAQKRILQSLNAFAKAKDGKLNEPIDK